MKRRRCGFTIIEGFLFILVMIILFYVVGVPIRRHLYKAAAAEAAAVAKSFPIEAGRLLETIETEDCVIKVFCLDEVNTPNDLTIRSGVGSFWQLHEGVYASVVVVSKFPIVDTNPLKVRAFDGEVRLADCPVPDAYIHKGPNGYKWLLALFVRTKWYDGTVKQNEAGD